MRNLSANDIQAAITMNEAIAAVREGYVALAEGRARVPLRSVLPISGGVTLTMPGYVAGDEFAVVKIVSVCADNPGQGLPTINGRILVIDAKTGVPAAIMDGSYVTALRTGAGSGVATDLLAREDARILAVIGSGAQARTQIEAVRAVRDIDEIRIYSPNNAARLADELSSEPGLSVRAVGSTAEAVGGADVVVAATNSRIPVVLDEEVSSGVHINGVGSFTHEMQEIAAGVVARARVVVDHYESAWAEAGDLIIPRDEGMIEESHVYAQIGEIASGAKAGRGSADEITFFKSVGNAVQDAVVAGRIAAIAGQRGLGTVLGT